MLLRHAWIGVIALIGAWNTMALGAVMVVRPDGIAVEGQVVSQSDKEIVFAPDGAAASAPPLHFPVGSVRVVKMDEHGAAIPDPGAATQPARFEPPVEPAAPPVLPPPGHPTYYLIPLHGDVGETVLASALDKSLADAVARKPTVVVLDIDSPGGLVEESKKIIDLLHHYNKKLRIVAYAGQDLSAAAIFSLSVREIYVKPSCTIGAATSFMPNNLMLPPKIEEKMQSAWRAVARNSAEEGRHEPLLADAMIDSSNDLHLETVDGKPVVTEGEGPHMLRRRGKILTLTSHEAVDCGLAAGEADDLDELGAALKLDHWTECKGFGTLLADDLPKRSAAFKVSLQKIMVRFERAIQVAAGADPASSVTTVTRVVPAGPPVFMPPVPGRPMIPGRPTSRLRTETVTITRTRPKERWKTDSLTCVAALQQSEDCIHDAIALCDAYGRNSEKEMLNESLQKIASIRETTFNDRNKYGDGINADPNAMIVQRAPVRGGDLPEGAVKTEQLGGHGGNAYVDVAPSGQTLIGFHYSFGQWAGKKIIRDFQPIYSNARTSRVFQQDDAVAKEGYCVSALDICSDDASIIAVRVTYAKMKDGVADPKDSYQSGWLGEPDSSPVHTLPSEAQTVIGTFGRHGLNMDAMGLVVMPQKKSDR